MKKDGAERKNGIIAFYRRFMNIFYPFYTKFTDDNIFAIAGQSAFFLTLSIVPLVIFTVSLMQGLHVPVEFIRASFGKILSENDTNRMIDYLRDHRHALVGGKGYPRDNKRTQPYPRRLRKPQLVFAEAALNGLHPGVFPRASRHDDNGRFRRLDQPYGVASPQVFSVRSGAGLLSQVRHCVPVYDPYVRNDLPQHPQPFPKGAKGLRDALPASGRGFFGGIVPGDTSTISTATRSTADSPE